MNTPHLFMPEEHADMRQKSSLYLNVHLHHYLHPKIPPLHWARSKHAENSSCSLSEIIWTCVRPLHTHKELWMGEDLLHLPQETGGSS